MAAKISGDNENAAGCCGCMVLVLLAIAIEHPVGAGITVFILIVLGILAKVGSDEQKREEERKQKMAWRRTLGGGDARLGADIEACQRRIEQLQSEVQELQLRLQTVRLASQKLASSRLRNLADTYDRAEQVLTTQHIEPRNKLIADWTSYLRDLEAMAAARQAESALDGLPDTFRYGDQLADERERLDRLTGELTSLAEVEQMLRE